MTLIPSNIFSQTAVSVPTRLSAETLLNDFGSLKNIPDRRHFMRVWENTEGLGEVLSDETTKGMTLTQQTRECFRNFLIIEEEITNTEMFWMMFGYMYSLTDMSSAYVDNVTEAVKRYDRRTIHINEKYKLANYVNTKIFGDSAEKVKQRLDKYNVNDEITLYRGFICRKDFGARIRESDDPSDEAFFKQREGVGCSYSMDREIALAFATRWTDFNIYSQYFRNDGSLTIRKDGVDKPIYFEEEYFANKLEEIGINPKTDSVAKIIQQIEMHPDNELISKIRKHVGGRQLRSKKNLDEWDETFEGFGVRPVIATFKVKKIDMVMPLNLSNQLEIVALPEDAKLVRYDFVSSEEIFEAQGIHSQEG